MLSKKELRKEKKKNKLVALVRVAEMNSNSKRQQSSDKKYIHESDKPVHKRMKRSDETDSDTKINFAVNRNFETETKNIITQDEDHITLQLKAKKIVSSRKSPKVSLKVAGQQASLFTHVDNRVPILFTDVQHLLLNSLIGEQSPYLPLRWCQLEKSKSISHTVVLVINEMSMYDYSSHQSVFSAVENFQHRLEIVTPSLYKGSVIDELAIVPLSELHKDNLIKTYGSMDVAMESRKDLMIMIRAVFPIVEGERPKIQSDVILDRFSRTQLVLSAWQLLEENYPLPLMGKLRASYSDYKMTKDKYEPVTASSPMFGLDCEMCRTKKGFELTRISIVNEEYQTIYDKYVLPYNEILDYMTKFSGITKETLSNITTRLKEVQKDLQNLLPPDAILVGQSLNFDLHALKMMHPYIIDTSVIYNTTGNKGRKTKLKCLAREFLKKNIQKGDTGHCSTEDAITSLQLVQLKLSKHITFGDAILIGKNKTSEKHEYLKTKKKEYITNIFTEVVPKNKSCLFIGSTEIINTYSRYLKCFKSSEYVDKIKFAEFDNNPVIINTLFDSSKNYNLTLAHVKMTTDLLKKESTYVTVNNWLENIWNYVESKCLVMVILSGSETCNGVIFIGLKK